MKPIIYIALVMFVISINLSVAASHATSSILLLIAIYDFIKNKRKLSFLKTGYEYYFLFFVLACLASTLVNYDLFPEVFKSFLQVRWIITFYTAYYLLKVSDPQDLEKVTRVFLLVAAISGLYALFQYLTGIQLIRTDRDLLEMPRPSLHFRFRAIGFFNNPMTFGHSIALALPMAFSYFIYTFKDKAKILFSSIVLASILIGLFASLTRGAYVAGFMGVVFTTFLIKKRYVMYTLSATFIFLAGSYLMHTELAVRILSIFQRTNSLISRVEIWSAYFEMFKDNPFFGIGLDIGQKFLPHYYELIGGTYNQIGHAHNTYLQFLATGGLICLIAYVALNFKFVKSMMVFKDAKTKEQYLLAGTAGSILAFLFGGLTECNYIDSEIRFNYLFYLVIAAVILNRMHKGKHESDASVL